MTTTAMEIWTCICSTEPTWRASAIQRDRCLKTLRINFIATMAMVRSLRFLRKLVLMIATGVWQRERLTTMAMAMWISIF
ncbi:MAG: hypothetical protein ACE5I5_15400 [Candidatus Heimdallarchaeota archaeon]